MDAHRGSRDVLRATLTFFAGRRLAGVGLAVAAEIALLVGLALTPPSAALGIPAAVATAIAGTVAVVFGVLDGVFVALAGALVFAAAGGWAAGELAALAVWPGIVTAVGLFARRIERHRIALGQIVTAQEQERKRVALELHDETAQVLASALMILRAASRVTDDTTAAEAGDRAREMISETIQALRALAVELSPQALEDYGLAPALERLTATLSEQAGLDVRLDVGWNGRASDEVELTLFRIVQDALTAAVAGGARSAAVTVNQDRETLIAVIDHDGGRDESTAAATQEAQRERLRLLGGTLTTTSTSGGRRRIRAEVGAAPRVGTGEEAS